MTKKEAISVIERSPLHEFKSDLVAALLPSARLFPNDCFESKGNGSRLGGLPSLPLDVAWPRWDCVEYLEGEIRRNAEVLDRVPPQNSFAKTLKRHGDKLSQLQAKSPLPLVFLAQIDLADLAGLEVSRAFPSPGMLWLFCDMFQQPWGFDPASSGAWRCFYSSSKSLALASKPPMIPDDWMRPPMGIRIEQEFTLPPIMNMRGRGTLTRKSCHDYDRLCEQLSSSDEPIYRLGGHPQEAGEDMRLEIQLAANGVFCGDPSALSHPRRPMLEPGAKEWTLLLQLDSGGKIDWCWGDMGHAYFWCRSEAMRNGDFKETWLAIGSH